MRFQSALADISFADAEGFGDVGHERFVGAEVEATGGLRIELPGYGRIFGEDQQRQQPGLLLGDFIWKLGAVVQPDCGAHFVGQVPSLACQRTEQSVIRSEGYEFAFCQIIRATDGAVVHSRIGLILIEQQRCAAILKQVRNERIVGAAPVKLSADLATDVRDEFTVIGEFRPFLERNTEAQSEEATKDEIGKLRSTELGDGGFDILDIHPAAKPRRIRHADDPFAEFLVAFHDLGEIVQIEVVVGHLFANLSENLGIAAGFRTIDKHVGEALCFDWGRFDRNGFDVESRGHWRG